MIKLSFFWLLLVSCIAYSQIKVLDKVVAIVNDEVITATELQEAASKMQMQLIGQHLPLPADNVLRKQVLTYMIDESLQLQLAKQQEIAIDELALKQAILKVAAHNKITVAQLRKEVEKQGLTWKDYQETLRKEMILSRIQVKNLGKNIVISAKQIDEYLKTPAAKALSNKTYGLQNIIIPLKENPTKNEENRAYAKALQILDKGRKNNFQELAIQYSDSEFALESNDLGVRKINEFPEIFKNYILFMQVGEVKGPIRAGNGYQLIKLTNIAESEKQPITKYHVRHILIKHDNNISTLTKAKALKLYQTLRKNKNFAFIARQYSQDLPSAAKGGDLGWVKSEDVVPEFAKAMSELPLNTISKPIQSNFGWHIIEVIDYKTINNTKEYEHEQAKQFLEQKRFQEELRSWQQNLRTAAYVKILEKELV